MLTAACLGGVHCGGASSDARVLTVWVVPSNSRSGHVSGGILAGAVLWVGTSKEAMYIGKASVHRRQYPALPARLTEHIRFLYRPGLKDANRSQYWLLRRKLWRIRSSLRSLKLWPRERAAGEGSRGRASDAALLRSKLLKPGSGQNLFDFQ